MRGTIADFLALTWFKVNPGPYFYNPFKQCLFVGVQQVYITFPVHLQHFLKHQHFPTQYTQTSRDSPNSGKVHVCYRIFELFITLCLNCAFFLFLVSSVPWKPGFVGLADPATVTSNSKETSAGQMENWIYLRNLKTQDLLNLERKGFFLKKMIKIRINTSC